MLSKQINRSCLVVPRLVYGFPKGRAVTFYCDRGCRRLSSSYPLTTFLVIHERRGAYKKRSDFYTFAFFSPFFSKAFVCLFICVPERVKLKEAGKNNKQTKQKNNDDGDNNWPGGRPGGRPWVLSAYTYLTLLTMKKKSGHKRLPYLVLYNSFLGNAGGKCVAKKEDICFDIKVVTDS